jgi:LPS-assembly protein
MSPAVQRRMRAFLRLWPALSTAGCLLAAGVPAALQAQAIFEGIGPAQSEPAEDDPADDAAQRQIGFEADNLAYEAESETISASGNVILRSEGQSLRAQEIRWDRAAGLIVATGDVFVVDRDGNRLFTQRLELTDGLKAGAMDNMLLALREGGRLSAQHGQRDEAGDIVLTGAAYSGCAVEDAQGCPETPSWRITAERVVIDMQDRRVRFKGAMLELFTTTDGRAISGLLIPNLRISASNGVEISGEYYWRLAQNQDLTIGGYTYTEAPPMVRANYRGLFAKGALQATGYLTRSSRITIGPDAGTQLQAWRGYFEGNGRYQFNENWSATGSIRVASDRTFLRRYDISRDDRLRSTINVERIDENSYLSIAGWVTQTMRIGAEQGQVPIALPVIDYRERLDDSVLGGKVEFHANSLAIMRTSGQDTQRAFAGVKWDLTRITSWGQEVTLTAMARGDLYHSSENELTGTDIYRGNPGWQGRGVALGAVDVKWPFVGEFLGGTQVLTPRFQVVASPPMRNLEIPNEDARAIDLEDSNLFALNRFPGYDRVEDGVRFTLGLDWLFERPGLRIRSTVGQSYRLTSEPTLLPDGTGLTDRVSDFVGRTEVRLRDFIKVTHRFRIDKDSLAVRRNEFDAAIGDNRTYLEVGYLRLNRDISIGLEDLQDREEVRVAGRAAFASNWSVFGSGVFNLTDRDEDPSLTSDGFEALRTRLGVAYTDDCLELGVTWRRDYVATGDAQKGNTYQIYIAFRNLGF